MLPTSVSFLTAWYPEHRSKALFKAPKYPFALSLKPRLALQLRRQETLRRDTRFLSCREREESCSLSALWREPAFRDWDGVHPLHKIKHSNGQLRCSGCVKPSPSTIVLAGNQAGMLPCHHARQESSKSVDDSRHKATGVGDPEGHLSKWRTYD